MSPDDPNGGNIMGFPSQQSHDQEGHIQFGGDVSTTSRHGHSPPPLGMIPTDPATTDDASSPSETSPPALVITGTANSAPTPSSTVASLLAASPNSVSSQHGLSKGQLFAATFFPSLVVLVTAILILFHCRLRRRRRSAEARELKDFPPTHGGSPTANDQNAYSLPASLPQNTSNMNSSYHDRASATAFPAYTTPQPANGMNYQEDPPPPYQPGTSSVATDSAPQGLLHPQPRRLTETNLFTNSQASNESPFDDPRDEDAVSDISEPEITGQQRDIDEHSVVSDLSEEHSQEITAHHVV